MPLLFECFKIKIPKAVELGENFFVKKFKTRKKSRKMLKQLTYFCNGCKIILRLDFLNNLCRSILWHRCTVFRVFKNLLHRLFNKKSVSQLGEEGTVAVSSFVEFDGTFLLQKIKKEKNHEKTTANY